MADALARPSGGAATKRRSSNPARAAMTGAGILASSAVPKIANAIGSLGKLGNFAGGMPLATFGVPFAGPAIGVFGRTLFGPGPGFNYDPVAAGRMSSRDLRKLGSVFPQTESEKHRVFMGPGLDAEVGGSGRTRRDIQQEKLLHPGGPLAFSLAHRETLDPDIRKRLAEVIPEDAIVHSEELGKQGNKFTDVMSGGRRISRTRGHMLPVREAFGFRPRPTVNPGSWR